MPRKPARPPVRLLRWSVGALAVLAVPKCLVCVAAYAAALLGLGALDSEICGAETVGLGAVTPWLIGATASTAALSWIASRRKRRVFDAGF